MTTLIKLYFIVVVCANLGCAHINNVCGSLKAYMSNMAVNPNCWYDPEVDGNLTVRAKLNGFLLERYTIKTEDEYILVTFRLKRLNKPYGKFPIFLQHGLGSDAESFLMNKENSIAYYLAKHGLDVWLGNFRGCDSCKHEKFNSDDSAYWDFSFHEHGLYDLPANFQFIATKTQKEIIYLSHSMGGTAFGIYASMKPQECKSYIRHAILLTPSFYRRHSKGLTRADRIKQFYPLISILPSIGYPVLYKKNSFERNAIPRFCSQSFENVNICLQLLAFLAGPLQTQLEPEKLPIALQAVKTTCIKNIHHYAQQAWTGEFQMYDYDPKENTVRYNRTEPPKYNLSAIEVSVTMIYATSDILTAPEDIVEAFNRHAKPTWDIYGFPFNHVEFLFSKEGKKSFLPLLVKIINERLK